SDGGGGGSTNRQNRQQPAASPGPKRDARAAMAPPSEPRAQREFKADPDCSATRCAHRNRRHCGASRQDINPASLSMRTQRQQQGERKQKLDARGKIIAIDKGSHRKGVVFQDETENVV